MAVGLRSCESHRVLSTQITHTTVYFIVQFDHCLQRQTADEIVEIGTRISSLPKNNLIDFKSDSHRPSMDR